MENDYPQIHRSMIGVMRDVKPIGLTEKKGITFKYRSIQDVYAAVHEVLHKNEVHCITHSIEPMPAPDGIVGRLYTFRFYASDGSYVDTKGEGAGTVQYKGDDKYPGKAQSYADKYALISALKIPLPELDDSDSVPPPKEEKKGSNGGTNGNDQRLLISNELKRLEINEKDTSDLWVVLGYPSSGDKSPLDVTCHRIQAGTFETFLNELFTIRDHGQVDVRTEDGRKLITSVFKTLHEARDYKALSLGDKVKRIQEIVGRYLIK